MTHTTVVFWEMKLGVDGKNVGDWFRDDDRGADLWQEIRLFSHR